MKRYLRNIRNNIEKTYFRNADESFIKDQRIRSSISWLNTKSDIPDDAVLDAKLSDFKWPIFKNTKFDQGL